MHEGAMKNLYFFLRFSLYLLLRKWCGERLHIIPKQAEMC